MQLRSLLDDLDRVPLSEKAPIFNDLHRDAPPYTIPEGTLIVNNLIMLTHNHEEEDGSHFLFVPSSSSGFPDPWVERAVPFKRGTAFFFNALDVHRASGIPKASPTWVAHPRLMAFFAIELTQGGNLRFPNLHVTQAITRPQLGAPGGRVAKTVQCNTSQRMPGVRRMRDPSPLSAICVVGAHSGGEVCVESRGVLHSPTQVTPMRLDAHGGGVVDASLRP